MFVTLVILAAAIVAFAIGKIRSDLVALCALISLVITDILSPEEALSGFSNPVVIMLVGLFVVSGAVMQTGLSRKLGSFIRHHTGENETALFVAVILLTAVMSAFIGTGTVALMLPVVVSMAARTKMNVSRMLMPIAFACSMGGMLTLIGAPTNLVVQDEIVAAGLKPLSFFSFFPIGLTCIVVGIVVLVPLSKWVLASRDVQRDRGKKGKSLDELVKEYKLAEKIVRYEIGIASDIVGKTVADLDVNNLYGLTIIEIRRTKGQNGLMTTVSQKLAGPDVVIERDDVLYVVGDQEKMEIFAEDYNLEKLDEASLKDTRGHHHLEFYDIGIAEIVLMPSSKLCNRLLREGGFREKYNINVLGIRRSGTYIFHNLANRHLHSGDVLLVQGAWSNIERLSSDEADWVVLGQPLDEASKVTINYRAPMAALILLLMVAMMVFDFIPVEPVTAVMIAGVLTVFTGCFRNVESAYKTINWESVVLIAAMMPMSLALEKTGVAEVVSEWLVSSLGSFGPVAMLAGIYITTNVMTMFISSTATAVLFAPIAMSSANAMGVSPYPFIMAVAVAAMMCFASPFSTPPNALVLRAGNYTFTDYVKVGLPLQVIMMIVMMFALPLFFPF